MIHPTDCVNFVYMCVCMHASPCAGMGDHLYGLLIGRLSNWEIWNWVMGKAWQITNLYLHVLCHSYYQRRS